MRSLSARKDGTALVIGAIPPNLKLLPSNRKHLFLRDFFGFFFTLVFPAIMLILFGSIYGNTPMYPGSSLGSMDISVPAYAVMVIGVTGLMAFPLTLAECKEKKIYKRFCRRQPFTATEKSFLFLAR